MFSPELRSVKKMMMRVMVKEKMVMMNRVEGTGHWAESKVSLPSKCH